MRILKYIIFFALILLPLFCSLHSPMAAERLSVKLNGQTLSVSAENAALQAILLEIAAEGISVRIDPQINPLITTHFKNRPIEQALESFIKPLSYSLIWEANRKDNVVSGMHLAEIQIFQSGRKDLMKPLLPPRVERIVKNKQGIHYVKDEILLYLTAKTDIQKLKALVRQYNAKLIENPGFPSLVKLLLPADSDVFAITKDIKSKLGLELVQPNYAYPLHPPVVYAPDTVTSVFSPGFYAPTDNGFPIAILDSGLAENSDLDKFILTTLDIMNPGNPITDTLGHGTQMAFIASGVVKPYGADSEKESYNPIIPIRAFDDNGYTTDFKIIDSINFALKNNARVMSLSWGSETRSDLMGKAFQSANTNGLIIVASAGNQPTGKPIYPAAYPSVIGVGALDPHGKTWENSNYGNFVAIYAPGFATLPVGHKGDPGLYAGTSISAAHVANTIAGYLSENPAATLQEVREYLDKKY